MVDLETPPPPPVTQHCKSVGPVQYPETDFPPFDEHNEVCIQVPDPDGVLHLLLVQHLMSSDPGQRFEVTVPEQQPAEIDTQTPLTPPAEHVAEYEHEPKPRVASVELA